MKNPLQVILMAALALLLASCAEVTSKQIIGDKPAKLDPKKWNGVWNNPDGDALQVRVKDADKGVLEAAWLDVKDDAFAMKKVDLYVREAGGWFWASFREDESKDYTIARVGEPDKMLLVWSLNTEPIIQRVKSGALKGEVMKDDKGNETKSVRLEGLHDADLEAIRNGKWGDVFNWDKPALILKHHQD